MNVNRFLKELDETTRTNVERWLGDGYAPEVQAAVREMAEHDRTALVDAFYCNLSFGTGGMRGVMGPGTNRMNIYTVRAATQGFVNYLLKTVPDASTKGVVVSYDSRHNSRLFAEETAKVLVGNGIKAYIFNVLHPVPLISFAVRHLGAAGGVMLTASHNPPAYNGYKVYWSHGGQVVAPHDVGIVAEVNQIVDPSEVNVGKLDWPDVEWIGEEIDDAYLDAVRPTQTEPQQNQKRGRELRVVYSSLHGSGITVVPKVLDDWGFTNLAIVETQAEPNGDFPTVKVPNPEDREALTLGIEEMEREGADLLIATDPDADRIGVAVAHRGETVLLNGNEFIAICLDYLCTQLSARSELPERAAFVKTIVTTELFSTVARTFDRPCYNVLTGFKYIGELIEEWNENPLYLFGGEESYGCLLGRHARDKDAVSAAALICEVALHEKVNGRTLIDRLYAIYETYGVYRERLVSITREGKAGLEQIAALLAQMRREPPREIAGSRVVAIEDYQTSQRRDCLTGEMSELTLPKSNVLLYWLEDGSKLVVRPSGTEPKVKFYAGATIPTDGDVELAIRACDARTQELVDAIAEASV